MSSLTAAEACQGLTSAPPGPLYVVFGPDPHERDAVVKALIECVEEELRPFNVERFRGAEASVPALLDAARTLPFGAPRRVVIVLDAESLLEPKRESEVAVAALDMLEAYVRAPSPSTSLVLVAQTLDRRRRIVGRLLEASVVVFCEGPGSGREAWVRGRLRGASCEIDRDALGVLVQRAGADMMRLRGDVDRLLTYVGEGRRISREDVLAIVGDATSNDPWGMTKALEQGRIDVALRELAMKLHEGAIPVMVLGQLGWFVRAKLPPELVPAAVEALFRTDREMKSSRDPRMLLERLVVEIGRGLRPRGPLPRARA